MLFCSSVYNMAEYDRLSQKSKLPLSMADHNLNYNFILGLDEALNAPISLINHVPLGSYPKYPKIFFKRQLWSHIIGADDQNCGFINLPIIKEFSRSWTTFFALKKEAHKNAAGKMHVVTYDLHEGICMGILLAKRLYPRIHTCVCLPDIPMQMLAVTTNGKKAWLKKVRAFLRMKIIGRFDSYVFLTEQMRDAVGTDNKPYVVVEGIYEDLPNIADFSCQNEEKKVVFYSGLLNPIYGLSNLIEAFLDIDQEYPGYELWLFGHGPMAEEIKKLSQSHPNIKYYGYQRTDIVRQYQAQATVLVNPRQNNHTYTQYSFPSKTLEYLASGCPMIGYRLDGIPSEYDTYIQYVEDNTVMALKNKIIEICSLSQEEQERIGKRNRQFILEKKNPAAQCKKIVDMWERLEKESYDS